MLDSQSRLLPRPASSSSRAAAARCSPGRQENIEIEAFVAYNFPELVHPASKTLMEEVLNDYFGKDEHGKQKPWHFKCQSLSTHPGVPRVGYPPPVDSKGATPCRAWSRRDTAPWRQSTNFYVECDARTDDVIAGGQQVGARPSHAPRHRQRPPEAAANRWALFHFVHPGQPAGPESCFLYGDRITGIRGSHTSEVLRILPETS